jgi:hypothetical protein
MARRQHSYHNKKARENLCTGSVRFWRHLKQDWKVCSVKNHEIQVTLNTALLKYWFLIIKCWFSIIKCWFPLLKCQCCYARMSFCMTKILIFNNADLHRWNANFVMLACDYARWPRFCVVAVATTSRRDNKVQMIRPIVVATTRTRWLDPMTLVTLLYFGHLVK